jgi:transcription initiation factor TFIID TATA-box-binding protein
MPFDVHVENIVASTSLNVKVPLGKLVAKQKEAEYEPEQFPGLVYRLSKPKAAALIFSSGKIVCTGARNIEDVKKVIKKVVSLIRKSGVRVPESYKIDIENIVASAKIDARVNLDKIAYNLEGSEYEPEQFPGLVYRMNEPKVAFLLFGSGKIVCTGGRSVKDVKTALNKVYKKLREIGALMKEK